MAPQADAFGSHQQSVYLDIVFSEETWEMFLT